MKQFVPEYYRKFKCTAGNCRHTCCAGWEIDIDKYTLASWQNLNEPIKSFICDKICLPENPPLGKDKTASGYDVSDSYDAASSEREKPHLMLQSNNRCAFLNDEGLCKIILISGEDNLCQICTDHPRFRNFYSDKIEMGIGLCCEAAASLIVNFAGDFSLSESDDLLHPACQADADETKEEVLAMTQEERINLMQNEADIIQLRQALIKILQDRNTPIEARLQNVLEFCDTSLPELTASEWAEEFLALDRLDSEWTPVLKRLKRLGNVNFEAYIASYDQYIKESLFALEDRLVVTARDTRAVKVGSDTSISTDPQWQKALENLAVYFLYRHLPEALTDYDVLTKISFAVLSCQLLYTLCLIHAQEHGKVTIEDLAEYARMYSTEVEYSLDNLGRIYDILF